MSSSCSTEAQQRQQRTVVSRLAWTLLSSPWRHFADQVTEMCVSKLCRVLHKNPCFVFVHAVVSVFATKVTIPLHGTIFLLSET